VFTFAGLIAPIAVVFLLLIVVNAFRVLRQYERGVTFTLGRFSGARGPVLIFLVPWIQQIVRSIYGPWLSRFRARISSRGTTYPSKSMPYSTSRR